MAINDVKISELPDIGSGYTDNTEFVVAESNATFSIKLDDLKEATAFNIDTLPEEDDTALGDDSELTFFGSIMNKITLANFMKYVNSHITKKQRGSMRLATSVQQTITDDATPIVLTAFDSVVTQTSEFVCDPATNSIKYIGPGINTAIINVGLNIAFPSTEDLEVYLYVNGAPYANTPIIVRGAGTNKPSELYWSSDISLATNDTFDFRGRNLDTLGSYTLTYLRSSFRIDVDYNI